MAQLNQPDKLSNCFPEQRPPKISIIGVGNVGSHLYEALSRTTPHIEVVSRSGKPIDQLSPDSDFYIVSVKDDAIADVVASTPDYPGIWAHTSGSVPIQVFNAHKSKCGVIYPLQTFTKGVPLNMREVPFFVEGNRPEVQTELLNLARSISDTVEVADSDLRGQLHIAAVFACNFADFLWMQADDILRQNGLSIDHLMPLMRQALNKLSLISPTEALTGPARRGDIEILRKHLATLPPHMAQIYNLLSQSILNQFHPDKKL